MPALYIADDLGLSEPINAAILRAHRDGALDGAALMLGQPATAAAVAAARELPGLAVGWHVHLADSRPCTAERWPWGSSPLRAGLALGASARARAFARAEIRAQWDAYRGTGLPCRFVSGHHHLHVHPFVRDALIETLGADFAGWIRWGEPRFFGRCAARPFYTLLHRALQRRDAWPFATSTTLWGLDRLAAMRAAEIEAVLPTLGPGLHEFMFHPRGGAVDRDGECLLALGAAERAPGDAHAALRGPLAPSARAPWSARRRGDHQR